MTFSSWDEYTKFARAVKSEARYILSKQRRCFLDALVATCDNRKCVVEKGHYLCRAQLGHVPVSEPIRDDKGNEIDRVDVEWPYGPDRMFPLPDRATEGRANSKGIPCLYCSTDEKTAMAETRPWLDSLISLAILETTKDLSLVDFTIDPPRLILPFDLEQLPDGKKKLTRHIPSPDKWESIIWGDINRAFSEPVTKSDDTADYAPTQVIAEAFRCAGYDGIVYSSKLGSGKTVALFDCTAARLVSCRLYRVESVMPKFTPHGNPYA